MEIQESHRLLRPGQRVVDLGCWPGGWLQVAAQAVGPRGRVVGVDLDELEPPLDVPHVVTLCADLAEATTGPAIVEALGGRAAVVLCDAAPKLTGVRATDRAREEALLETVEALLPAILALNESAPDSTDPLFHRHHNRAIESCPAFCLASPGSLGRVHGRSPRELDQPQAFTL